ncbi:Protein kinase domain [Dillenia turbinata]|uniref:non-specific serine/threonine protein kinase n=1 Tax=Dillenia turbinata TaxID=194707 RepID=A0AAN8VP50_9MAGN
MRQSLEDLSDDLYRLSFNTTTSTTTVSIPDKKCSTSSSSETATLTSFTLCSSIAKGHAPSANPCWDAIQRVRSDKTGLGFYDLRFLQQLGGGDIGSVYLTEIKGAEGCVFATKVMDKKELVSRYKEGRARIEREILEIVDHPFLPTLFACLDTSRWSCLLTEFCPGGDLHILRQRQPEKRFDEAAVRFYASEVVVALEYLHMLGIIYRDLKPENVLVRSDGHIMLTDFDLSLKCNNSSSTALLVTGQDAKITKPTSEYPTDPPQHSLSSCILPNCIVPSVPCFHMRRRRKRRPGPRGTLEIVAEPLDVRSMSFVGTHEYLAPEIISGDGHGNAVDWWTLGIFIFELFYGVTPFRGFDNELTLANIVARALEFPKEPNLSAHAKDLISQLLIKDPDRRMGSTMGAAVIKHHPFFDGVNWALLRCAVPPYIPKPVVCQDIISENGHCQEDTSFEYF